MDGKLLTLRDDRSVAGSMFETTPSQRAALPVLLVSMPFMEVNRPSIQLGLLKAIGDRYGFSVRTLHANLDFAVRIGLDTYRRIAEHRGHMIGDWLFSVEAFGQDAPDRAENLLDEIAGDPGDDDRSRAFRDELLRIRRTAVPRFLDDLLDGGGWDRIRVVGFTSTFHQNTASFALARRLKERFPGIVTLFGGANFDSEMGVELVRTVDCIDLAVIGEGDIAFPRVLSALAAEVDVGTIPGVARRVGQRVVATPPESPFERLDDLPNPDYGEYFAHARTLGLHSASSHRNVWIPFESARGCWWGAKHHCTFCGLNGTTMTFRSKSPGRVLEELGQQARRYQSFSFEAIDNIMDFGYLKTLLPTLIDRQTDYQMFYEMKANLSRAQLKLLAQAGVTRIQPGLESLSSHVLALMRKGVRAAQNVNLLRWAQYYDIHISWNILWGFPGELEEDYRRQSALIPSLFHLQPPSNAGRIWLERFSPLFFDRQEFKFRSRTPERSYKYVYPSSVDLEKVAYFFDYELEGALPESAYFDLVRNVDAWSDAWAADTPPTLTYWSAPGFLQIYDGRYPGREGTYTFTGKIADIYVACTERPVAAVAVRQRFGIDLPVQEIADVLVEFERRRLMFLDGTLAIALALPAVRGR